jgi:hypothetical protein
MELKGFRELLLKKAQGNSTLQMLIAFAKDDILADKVIELLEKMAKPSVAMGRSANAPVVSFAGKLKNSDVKMMRDHLGHHLSHYKAALKASQDPSADPKKAAQHRDVADQHLNKLIPAMHLIGKAAPHSNGLLGLDYTVPRAWEENYTRPDQVRPSDGKTPIEETQGLNRRPRKTQRNPLHESHPDYEKLNSERGKGSARAVSDYRYLEIPPHPLSTRGDHVLPNDKGEHVPHKGGYPFERIQVGNPMDVDKKEAHLHLFEPKDVEKFTPHPFDEHPIQALADVPQKDLKDHPRMVEFADSLANWHQGDTHMNWLKQYKDEIKSDPEGYKNRGKVRPPHFYEGLNLQESEHHIKHHKDKQPAESAPQASPPSDKKSAPVSKETPNFSPEELAKLPPALQAIYSKRQAGGQ